MADRELIQPDRGFIQDVMAGGGHSLKKCFQCATCSAVCPLSPEERPFPRKEMLWAQWGLRERLLHDPDVWRCYDCGDCSTQCPRGAKPSEIMGAVRNQAFQYYSRPGFLGKMVGDPAWLPILLAIPALIFLGVLYHVGNLKVLPTGPIQFGKFLPHLWIDGIFIAVSAFVGASLVAGLSAMWKAMDEHTPHGPNYGKTSVLAAVVGAATDVIAHRRFNECGHNNWRFLGHFTAFYGFVALFIVTAIVFVGLYVFKINLPLPLTNPVKILANIGAVLLLVGTSVAVIRRLSTQGGNAAQSSYADWLFLLVLFGVGLSGTATEVIRLLNKAQIAYWTYYVHIVLVFFLIAYLPFSKLAHLAYRFLGLVYARHAGLGEGPALGTKTAHETQV